MLGRSSFLVAALISVLWSSSAHADDSRAQTLARKDLTAGIDQYKAGDYEGARISFQRSFATWPTGDALRRLAQAELRSGHPLEALQHFRMYKGDRNADADFVANDLPKHIAECNAALGHLALSVPREAILMVDGRRAPEPVDGVVDVMPGEHKVALRGLEDQSRTVLAPAGKTVPVDLREAASPTIPPTVTKPVAPPPTPPTSSSQAWPPPTVSLIFAGISGASLIVGTTYAVIKSSNASDRESFRESHPGVICNNAGSGTDACDQWKSKLDSESKSALIANVAFGVALGTASIAMATWVLFPRSTTGVKAQIVPAFGAGHAGVQIGGRF